MRQCALRVLLRLSKSRESNWERHESLDFGNNGVNSVNDTDCVHCTALCKIEMFDLREVHSLLDPCKDLHIYVTTIEHNELGGMNRVYKIHEIREFWVARH